MSVWLVRAGKFGEDESASLEKGLSIIGWHEMPDASHVKSYEEMKKKLEEVYPEHSTKANMNNAAQLWSFLERIKVGDIIVMPLKTRSTIAIGKVTGGYDFKDGRHTRPVKWIKEDIPRNNFGQDLLYSLGAFMTICQIKRNDAESRIKQIMDGKRDPQLGGKRGDPIEEEEKELIDLEEQAFDQIRRRIESKFKGHGLTRLVEAVLNVQGYHTYRSPEGPDGGIDILAGMGPMGFDESRVCVQVKSGGVQNDIAIRELEGVMSRMGAQKGLFVSWDGFNKTAQQHTRDLFFKVRLWGAKELMERLLENYEKLPEQIQAELPLKRIWVIVPEEE